MIPKLLHTYWEGERPEWVDEHAQQIQSLHPDWTHIEWSPENNVVVDELADLFETPNVAPAHFVSFRSNLARYSALWTMGGIWLDSDMQVYSSLEPLRIHSSFLPAGERNPQVCMMGAEPFHPFIERVIRAASSDYPNPHRLISGVRHVHLAGTDDVTLVARDILFVPNQPDQVCPPGVLAAHLKSH